MSLNFDPGAVGQANGNFFGFPFTSAQSALVLVRVPWDVTTSYGGGAANGPEAILRASPQLDFYHPNSQNAWEQGIATATLDLKIQSESQRLRPLASEVISALESGLFPDKDALAVVNRGSEWLNDRVRKMCLEWLQQGKLVGLVGGDHSTPLGLMQALGELHETFGILQIDAHADLRPAYEGFNHSHASIMHNALQLRCINKLVQVGVRDYSAQEATCAAADERIALFDGGKLRHQRCTGVPWQASAKEIVQSLPQKVYISFDIDGLDPSLCPNTGTPVPGGLSFDEVVFLIQQVRTSGRQIIGFDLNEVSPGPHGDWDANVGARVLFELCCYTLAEQGVTFVA
ncbi:MAG: agmatinase family protein [Flavobacteriales bacterium]|nr:agmatinase family protein [Flavobacteriales bacterium]